VNLEPLLCHLYNELVRATPLGLSQLEPQARPSIAQEPDHELVRWLLGQAPAAW
jgi:hypothetical protein